MKFGNVILCEDVREELRKKNTLVGVISGDILVDKFPAVVELAFLIEVHDAKAGDELEFDLRLGKAKGKSKFVVPSEGRVGNIALHKMGVRFEAEGKIQMRVSVNGGPFKTLLARNVQLGEVEAR